MNKLIYIAIGVAIGCMFSGSCLAGHITMTHDAEITVDTEWVDVHLTIKNVGDEDALRVYPTLQLGDTVVDLKKVPYIAFGGTQQWHHRFLRETLGINRDGRYPLYLLIHYHDAQMYPFSSANIEFAEFGQKQSDCIITGDFGAVKKNGKIAATFTISNPCSYPISGTCKVFLPKEFKALLSEKPFLLAQRSSQMITFDIDNIGGLKGSRYRIYGVGEYTDATVHSAFAIPGTIPITESISDNQNQYKILGCIVFIGILFLFTLCMELGKPGWKSGR